MSSRKITNLTISIQSGTDRTAYATWSISNEEHVDNYSYEWRYSVNNTWFVGSSGTSPLNTRSTTYSAPANAVKVEVRVIPNSKTYKKDKIDTPYFTGTWSAWAKLTFPNVVDKTPVVPPVPTVKVDKYTLTAQVDVYDPNGNSTWVDFYVVVGTKFFTSYRSTIRTNRASASWTIDPGKSYRVRARCVNSVMEGAWSQYSSDTEGITLPAAITGTPVATATSSTSVQLSWNASSAATSYVVEYTTSRYYFDTNPSQVSSATIESGTRADITGLQSGATYIFRVKAINDQGSSDWSALTGVAIGRPPSAPTTWSSTTTATVGQGVYLYWVHNSEDNSRENNAEIEISVNGEAPTVILIHNDDWDDPDKDTDTKQYLLDTSSYDAGAQIRWRVRTQGILDQFGEWSTQRLIEVYAPPTLNITLGNRNEWYWDPFDFVNGDTFTSEGDRHPWVDNIMTQFPMFIDFEAGPSSQTPVGYTVSIISNESYTDTDDLGNNIYIIEGQEIFNRYYQQNQHNWVTWLGANDVNLQNGMTYTVTATVAMDSGLTASVSQEFTVDWADDEFDLDAELSFDDNNIVAYIRPYCDNEEGLAVDGIILSVYRHEFDGSFTTIATNLSNILRPTVTDPHPTLNYARYRIVGISRYTGQALYYDLPPVPMQERSIVLQWNEEWSYYTEINEDEFANRPWTGSMLKLPYNVDVSETNNIDVELIDYIGRRHPVSYYGTQVGQGATWRADIDKNDEETIYALRRLSTWLGDVYVREPSGSGYWAKVKISFNQEHVVLTVPVTIEVIRVEGGI